jgi:hypothetical protein
MAPGFAGEKVLGRWPRTVVSPHSAKIEQAVANLSVVDLIPSWIPFAALTIAVSVAFLPVTAMSYSLYDDYCLLQVDGKQWVIEFFTSLGRPITGAYLVACKSILNIPYGNELCHFAGIAGAMLLAMATYRWLRRIEVAAVEAAFISFLICTLPSVQLYVAWTSAASSTYAACLATVALLIFDHPREIPTLRHLLPNWWRTAAAAALLIVAQLTYQPAALYFWSMCLAAIVLAPRSGPRELALRGLRYLVLGGGSLVAYAIILRAIIANMYPLSVRAQLVKFSDIPNKLEWFAHEPLHIALSLWSLWPIKSAVATLALFIVTGLLVKWYRWLASAEADGGSGGYARLVQFAWSLLVAVIVCAFIPLSYTFNLAVAENYPSYRTTFVLAVCFLLLTFAALDAWLAAVVASRQTPVRRILLATCSAIAMFSAHDNIIQRMIYPQAVELAYLQSELNRADLAEKSQIHVIRPTASQGVCPDVRYDEFGLPSAYAAWVPQPMVIKVLKDMKLDLARYEITHSAEGEPAPNGPHILVVDMRNLVGFRTERDRR